MSLFQRFHCIYNMKKLQKLPIMLKLFHERTCRAEKTAMKPENKVNDNSKAKMCGNNHFILHNSRSDHLNCFIQFLQFLCKLSRQPHGFRKCDALLNDCIVVKSLFHYIFLFFPLSPCVIEFPNPPFNRHIHLVKLYNFSNLGNFIIVFKQSESDKFTYIRFTNLWLCFNVTII